MKALGVLGFLALLALALLGCFALDWTAQAGPAASSGSQLGALPNGLHLAPQFGVAVPPLPPVLEPMPATATPQPRTDRYYRSYPAPTGSPGFRKYYQIRCYPGCHYQATPVVPGTTAAVSKSLERPYRSYPAPTGAAGFRHYYQIRCYPGCHTYPSSTPVPTRIHP